MPESATCPVRERALGALAELPPFSPILNRLIANLAQPDVSFAKIADLIEKDAVLAGNLLKLVNSALYGRRGTIESVRHAVAMLGVNKLRNAALSMSVARMWNHVKAPSGWSLASFNVHAVGVAILSDLLAQRLPVDHGEGAFAAGLFHDLGWLLVVLGCPEEYQRVSRVFLDNVRPALECEFEILGMSHADLSADALAVWNLPLPIQTAVRYHDRWEQDPSSAQVNRIPLSRIVSAADDYVRRRGNHLSVFEQKPQTDNDMSDSLGLGDQLANVLNEFDAQFSTIQEFF
jgi:HD-like signal output (HDOD) protein